MMRTALILWAGNVRGKTSQFLLKFQKPRR